MNLERLNKLRLLSALSGRFKDLEVLREEKLTKNAPKNGKLALLRQCHFLEQSNLLFSKYFEQIFSSPVNQIRDAFSLYLDTVQRGKREPDNQNRYALILDMRISGSSAQTRASELMPRRLRR